MSAILGLQPQAVEPRRPRNPGGLAVVPRQKSFLAQLIETAQEQNTELPAIEPAPAEVVPAPRNQPLPMGARLVARAIEWLKKNRTLGGGKQLRVSDTVSLGDKRFIAVAHVDGRKFLIGGGASGISLLTQLDSTEDAIQLRSVPAE